MTMKRGFFLLLILAGLTACSPLKPVSTTQIDRYSLSQIPKQLPKRPVSRKTLLVSMPIASPGYDTARIIYMEKPFELKRFARNQWVAPPAKMLQPMLVQTLLNTRRFHAVVSTPYSGITQLRLDTQLLKLEHLFIHSPSRVRMVVQVQLIDNIRNQVVADARFQSSIVAKRATPYAGVLAANEASSVLLSKVARFVLQNT